MTPTLFLLICLGGGLGAAARFMLDGAVRARWPSAFPWGTFLINVTGSFLLALLVEVALAGYLSEATRLVLGTGVLGGYTTFSTASLETVRLAQSRRYGLALGYGVGMLVGSIVAAMLGIALARVLSG